MTLIIHTACQTAVYTIQTLTAIKDKVLPYIQHKNHTSKVQENYIFFSLKPISCWALRYQDSGLGIWINLHNLFV